LRSEQVTKNIATVRYIATLFPIIEVSTVIIETFAELKAMLYKKGNPIDDMDLIVAATALSYNHTLVTNNERHFSGVPGLKIENWSKG
jgi:tRNA(fMet)-specific endonuclease VapC